MRLSSKTQLEQIKAINHINKKKEKVDPWCVSFAYGVCLLSSSK